MPKGNPWESSQKHPNVGGKDTSNVPSSPWPGPRSDGKSTTTKIQQKARKGLPDPWNSNPEGKGNPY